MVATIKLTLNTAAITATGTAAVESRTVVLTSTLGDRNLTWSLTGTCVATGLC